MYAQTNRLPSVGRADVRGQTHSSNKEMRKKLKQRIDSLNRIIESINSHDDKDIPDLKIVLCRFVGYVQLTSRSSKPVLTRSHISDMSKVADGLNVLESRFVVAQVTQASEISGELEGYVQSITWHVSDLQVSVLRPACRTKVGLRAVRHRLLSTFAYTSPSR